jgi:GlpG protein
LRAIGSIEGEGYARAFGSFLHTRGIDHSLEEVSPGKWQIWVHEEERLEEARQYLLEFVANPHADRFRQATLPAAERKVQGPVPAQKARVIGPGRVFSGVSFRFVSLSTALIVMSVFVALATMLGKDNVVTSWLSITGFQVSGDQVSWSTGLPEICDGQVWRLLTPIFLHFSLLHILFNMLWLRDLGSLIEYRAGTLRLLMLVVVIGVASNFGQYLVSGPMFGGMSGVVYGLFGYIWMRGKFDPSSGFFLTDQAIMIMVGWFVLCLVGIIPGVANAAHGVGLVLGMGFGWLAARKPVGFRRGR